MVVVASRKGANWLVETHAQQRREQGQGWSGGEV